MISAGQGGQVQLHALTSIDNSRPVLLNASGAGSEIDVSNLTTFNACLFYSQFNQTNQGTILDTNLTSVTGLSVTLDGTGPDPTAPWQSFDYGSLTINGGTYAPTGLTDVSGSNFSVNNGASLTLSGVTGYNAPLGNGNWTWVATGAHSILSLPNLTAIGDLVNNSMLIKALQEVKSICRPLPGSPRQEHCRATESLNIVTITTAPHQFQIRSPVTARSTQLQRHLLHQPDPVSHEPICRRPPALPVLERHGRQRPPVLLTRRPGSIDYPRSPPLMAHLLFLADGHQPRHRPRPLLTTISVCRSPSAAPAPSPLAVRAIRIHYR